MNRRLTLMLAAGAAGAVAIAGPLGALPKGTDEFNKNADPVQVACAEDSENYIEYAAPAALWPPNHKYYEGILITAVDGGDDAKEDFVLTTTGTHNQYEGDTEQNGTGNTGDDVRPATGTFNSEDDEDTDGNVEFITMEQAGTDGSATEEWWARAERSGHKSDALQEGREYFFTARATIDGEDCTADFKVVVPHDMRKANRDVA